MILSDLYSEILVAMHKEQQEEKPDMSNINSERFGIPTKLFAGVIKTLQDGGLIEGAVTQDGGDEPGPFYVSVGSANITLLGESVMRESGKI